MVCRVFPNTAIGGIFLSDAHQDYAQQIIQLLKYAELQHGIRLRILASEQIYTQIVKSIAIEHKRDRRQGYDEEKEGGRGLVKIRKQKGTFEIHLANTLRRQQQQRLRTNVSFLIVDSKVSLVEEELKAYNNKVNDSNHTFATYSNSESAVLAYVSIFETFWTQTELKIKTR